MSSRRLVDWSRLISFLRVARAANRFPWISSQMYLPVKRGQHLQLELNKIGLRLQLLRDSHKMFR